MTNEAKHIPVLLHDVFQALQVKKDDVIVDATFGAGGYTKAFLEKGVRVFAFDRDPNAIKNGEKLVTAFTGQLNLIHAPFSQMQNELNARDIDHVDAIVFDLGVSSMQIDEAERGFSFRHDGPLDMRMSSEGKSAADIVNTYDEEDIANILYQFGEEKKSRMIARAIVARRKEKSFTQTLELAQLIEKTIGRRPQDKIHPATRSFQGLRIAVNDELDEIEKALQTASGLLRSGGRLAVVTFHSLEDRIVKQFLAKKRSGSRHVPETWLAKDEWQASKLITPNEMEISANPRARSAKLRVATKI
ncbi:MAG: 16S rRNA (cytosine(1402)-N(4))-methyltransferase RsmH [Pseudomonadota bacterium]